MTNLANRGFETKAADPAGVGIPDAWVTSALASVWLWAQYAVDVPVGYEGNARETFELGWPDEAQYTDGLPVADLSTLALYGPTITPRTYEGFERLWEVPPSEGGPPLGTAHFTPALVYVEAATYAGETYESFWWGGVPLDFDDDLDLEFVDYSGADGAEDFEQGWKSNESYEWSGTWGGAQYADYARPAGGTNAYEGFSSAATRFLVTDVSLSSNNIVCDHSSDPLDEEDDVEFVVRTVSGVPEDGDFGVDLPRLPTPLRYRHVYYVTDVEGDTEIGGVALAAGGQDIPLTAKGGGEFYICRSRLTHWVSNLDV